MFQIKRIYEPAEPSDGQRVLVDRLWPRGISKEKAHLDEWLKEIAPSSALRQWFQHDPAKWIEFQQRYRQELDQKPALIKELAKKATIETVTLLYAAADPEHAHVLVLKELLCKTYS